MPARYAEASGDHNPIHLDPEVARAVGLPGAINHGLGTCALVSGGLVGAALGGDPTRLRRLAVRFTGMVEPGDDVTTRVWQDAGDGCPFETTRSDGTVVMTGTIQPARGRRHVRGHASGGHRRRSPGQCLGALRRALRPGARHGGGVGER
jgi:acyl dehydratase